MIKHGIDLVYLPRIKDTINRFQNRFINRILTQEEQNLLPKQQLHFIAGRFAAKEAIAKSLGVGIGEQLTWLDINVLKDQNGKPTVSVSNYNNWHFELSITHDGDYAFASVITYKKI